MSTQQECSLYSFTEPLAAWQEQQQRPVSSSTCKTKLLPLLYAYSTPPTGPSGITTSFNCYCFSVDTKQTSHHTTSALTSKDADHPSPN